MAEYYFEACHPSHDQGTAACAEPVVQDYRVIAAQSVVIGTIAHIGRSSLEELVEALLSRLPDEVPDQIHWSEVSEALTAALTVANVESWPAHYHVYVRLAWWEVCQDPQCGGLIGTDECSHGSVEE